MWKAYISEIYVNTTTTSSFKENVQCTKTKNIKVFERKIEVSELSNFVGCFLTGTAAEVTPVSSIDRFNFKVCNTIMELSKSYQDIVRKKIAA